MNDANDCQKRKAVFKLAYLSEKDCCPVCGYFLKSFRFIAVNLPSADQGSYVRHTCCVLYCDKCKLPYANPEVVKAVWEDTQLSLPCFIPEKDSSAALIDEQMFCDNPEDLGEQQIEVDGFKKALPKKIITFKSFTAGCPICRKNLRKGYIYIPVGKNKRKIFAGRICDSCDHIIVSKKDSEKIYDILYDNSFAKGFTLDGKALWNFTLERQLKQKRKKEQEEKEIKREEEERRKLERDRDILNRIPSAVVLIRSKFDNREKVQFIIVTDAKQQNEDNKVYYYASLKGREVLSAAFADQRNKKGILDGRDYKVIYTFSDYGTYPSEWLLPCDIEIKSGGGYFSHKLTADQELVDILLYSPFTQQYEISSATYDKSQEMCFMDIRLYRKFVRRYGNPGIGLYSGKFHDESCFGANLNNESILKEFGYNVDYKSHLSFEQRQAILAEIVDLEILSVSNIVDYLNFFINSHTDYKYYEACEKWKRDKEFIENYKVNPERFLIPKI